MTSTLADVFALSSQQQLLFFTFARTLWRDYISRLACERLGIPQNELENVAGEREVWVNLLGLLPPRPVTGISG